MDTDPNFDHSLRRDRYYDRNLGWCRCAFCVRLPYNEHEGETDDAPTSYCPPDFDLDDLGTCADDIPERELGGEGG